jgi:hypothetical protein
LEIALKVEHPDSYEKLGAEFQFQWIGLLKDTLKRHGVEAELAQKICGDFTFDFSMLIDQGEIDVDGKSYTPVIGFTADEETLAIQPAEFDFHEYAFGNTSEAFGQ